MSFRMVKIFLISGELLKSKVKVKPQKIEEHLFQTTIDICTFKTHTKQWVVPYWLHWLLQCALCCYQTAKARTLSVYFFGVVKNIIICYIRYSIGRNF